MATKMPWIANKSIIIAGGGISGLSLAISLAKRWPLGLSSSQPRVKILERDSESNRLGREGYTMSLRTDGPKGGGIQVLDDLDLYETVKSASALVFAEGGSMVMWDSNWNDILRLDSTKVQNNTKRNINGMRIRRNALQEALAKAAIQAGAEILWEHEAVDVKKVEGGEGMEVVLADGRTMTCDLFVAGDGSKSKIRSKLRPNEGLDFAGAVLTTGTARFASREDVPSPLEKDWGLVLGGKGIGMFLAPVDERSALWSTSVLSKEPSEPLRHPIAAATVEELLVESRDRAAHAGSKLRKLIDATDPSTLMRINCMDRPPLQHTPEKHGAVIWIGDSSHAVSPMAGNGANMALMDGWELAECLLSASSLEQCLLEFDKLVIPRTQAVLKQSRRNIDVAHASGWKATFYWAVLKVLSFLFGK